MLHPSQRVSISRAFSSPYCANVGCLKEDANVSNYPLLMLCCHVDSLGRGPHVQFAGDHVRDQAGSVFTHQFDLATGGADGRVDSGGGFVEVGGDSGLFGGGGGTITLKFRIDCKVNPSLDAPFCST